MTTIDKPKIEKRPKITYMGIRFIAPFKGMSKEITRIANELNEWADENSATVSLRYSIFFKYSKAALPELMGRMR